MRGSRGVRDFNRSLSVLDLGGKDDCDRRRKECRRLTMGEGGDGWPTVGGGDGDDNEDEPRIQ